MRRVTIAGSYSIELLHMRRFFAVALFVLLGLFPLMSIRAFVVAEPFGALGTSLRFQPGAVALQAVERAKFANFVHLLLYRYPTPVHECDIEVFVFVGDKVNGASASLEAQDELFEKRVSYLRELLQLYGLSKRIGHLIPPSKVGGGLSAEIDSVDIEIKYWIHQTEGEISQDHVDCKWPLPPRKSADVVS
ncbi:hypothetical protein HNP55_003885 [Paucibacter oligotrophus]|uniref:Uncharacterized protein n=1 Tax=Roseateles oligotrophus TaxID=1769250 RepID=A0A840LGJ0_9BURK|nr:hypothetical protein [Roseateles oligotrophus]MBB4845338.1 hypothetical protein [Roseateles oligotrophus]